MNILKRWLKKPAQKIRIKPSDFAPFKELEQKRREEQYHFLLFDLYSKYSNEGNTGRAQIYADLIQDEVDAGRLKFGVN